MSNSKEANIFTTGQVAKICQVAPRTVTKWFDSGQLKGYRIPGSQDRRIPHKSLVTFLTDNGMPLGELSNDTEVRILLIGDQTELVGLLNAQNQSIKTQMVLTTFEAGIAAVRFDPHCVVLDACTTQSNTRSIIQGLRRILSENCPVVGIIGEDAEDTLQDLFDESFRTPFDNNLISTRVVTLANQFSSKR